MGLALTVISLTILFLPVSSFAANYYVAKHGNNANSCAQATNQSTPKLTIQAGVSCATAAGDTVIVKAGTYTETVNSWPANGASGSPITLKANPGDVTIWRGPNSGCGIASGAIHLQSRRYIRIEGFRFDSTASQTVMRLIHLSTDKALATAQIGIEIVNNIFFNNGNTAAGTGCLSAPILWQMGGLNNSYAGGSVNFITGNTFDSNYGFNIEFLGTSNTLIANNTFTNVKSSSNLSNNYWYSAAAIAMFQDSFSGTTWVSRKNVIENNTIGNYRREAYANPNYEASGIRFDITASDNNIRRNIIHNINFGDRGPGLSMAVYNEHQSNNNLYEENIVFQIGRYGFHDGGAFVPNPVGNIYRNNVVWNVGTIGLAVVNARNGTYENNIIVNAGNAEIQVSDKSVALGGHIFRNNLYWNNGRSQIGVWNSAWQNSDAVTASLTFTQWSSVSGDTNSESANPLFINPPGDFHLQSGSPAINSGVNAVDMGAYPMFSTPSALEPPANLRVINP